MELQSHSRLRLTLKELKMVFTKVGTTQGLYTVQGMRARGYSPEAITQWWKDMGMTRRDIKAPLSSLDALNRDTSAKRAETFESDEYFDPIS